MQKAGFVLWILVCAILMLDIGNACVRAQNSSRGIKAREVDIVNSSGVTVIQLINTAGGSELNLSDPSGRMRTGTAATGVGGAIIFFDANQNDITVFGGTNEKDGLIDSLGFLPPDQARVGLVTKSDYNGLSIADKSSKERITISYNPSPEAAVIGTESGKDKTGVFAGLEGDLVHVVLDDPQATPRADFGIEPNNTTYFAVAGKDGSTAWYKAFDANGSATSLSGGGSNDSGGSGTGLGGAIRQNRSH